MKVLGIDIGGSAIKGAPVDTVTGRLLAKRHRIETPKLLSPAQLARAVAAIAAHFDWKGSVGIGFPGVIEGPRIVTAANLHPGFVGRDGVALFKKALGGLPLALTNDAAAAARAEMAFGAGRGFGGKTLVLTLGTGIGSALCLGGTVFPCEFGHLPVRGGVDAETRVSAAARKRRELSWEKWGRELGRYIRILERVLRPELIIIGGGVSAKSGKFFEFLELSVPLVPAQLLNEAGIAGAALYGAGAGIAAAPASSPARPPARRRSSGVRRPTAAA